MNDLADRLAGRAARHRVGRTLLAWLLRTRRRSIVRRLPRPLVVTDGPFKGLRYPERLAASALPRLLGRYETELLAVAAPIVERAYSIIINVGCAEGYYAVGLAWRLPRATVHAFDTDPAARAACRELARLNGVSDRVHLGGACDAEALNALPLDGAFILCDCEGCERSLLNPDLVPRLAGADLLVELHDFLAPGTTAILRERFAPTHDVTIIDSQPPGRFDHPLLAGLSERQKRVALSEFRPPGIQWAWMTRRVN